MKKRLLYTVLCSSWVSVTSAFNFSGCEEKLFTVTAYYSPMPNQIFYYKSSFADEVTLNGEGYTWASGKPVFNGMLAWPQTYAFWSIIYFPGVGVGEIADRGGAIVLSWEKGQNADRIDIRMGRGEEGLIKALTFGKKTMTWWYCTAADTIKHAKVGLENNAVYLPKYFFDIALRIQQLEEGRNDIRTRTLQKYLNKLGYLHKQYRHGSFDIHTKKALCNYQVAKKIVSRNNPDCGKFGKMTRYVMKLHIQEKWLLPKNLYEKGDIASLLELAQYYNGKPTESSPDRGNLSSAKSEGNEKGVVETKQTKIFLFYRAYSKWQQSSEIKILQKFLQSQWLYSWTIDGVYSKATTDAVYAFQKQYGLISDSDSLALRGYLWPKTRSKINELRQK